MILCSICACRDLNSMLLLVIQQQREMTGPSAERKKFRLINFIAGRLCVYRHIWRILFSSFSHHHHSLRSSVVARVHLVNLFMIWPELLSEEFWAEIFFCFISFLFYQKNFVMSTSTRRIKDDEVDFMPGWIERISGFSLRLFMFLSWVTQRTFCDFFGWWAFFLLMTSKQQHFSFHPIGWWAAIATRDFLPRAESLASFFSCWRYEKASE